MDRMQIESIKVNNFSVYKNLSLGKPNKKKMERLQRLCVFVGRNGVGKSTFFNIFKFLSLCLRENVTTAVNHFDEWDRLCSYGIEDSIQKKIYFEIKFRNFEDDKIGTPPLVTYELEITWDYNKEIAIVAKELLKYRLGQRGQPWHFIDTKRGKGLAITNENEYNANKTDNEAQRAEFSCNIDELGLSTVGKNQNYPTIFKFHELLRTWTKIDLKNNEMQKPVKTQNVVHLSENGDNIAYIAHYMKTQHASQYSKVIEKMQKYIPGIETIEPAKDSFGNWGLQFKAKDFTANFLATQISDGTIKFFGYLLLLHDPEPHPLLCVEEPENYLYTEILTDFAIELYEYAQRGGQVFVSTHSAEFLDAIDIEFIYIVSKKEGYSTITHAYIDKNLCNLAEAGNSMGFLWNSGKLEV